MNLRERSRIFFTFFLLLFLSSSLSVKAQSSATLNGTVTDAKENAPLIGVTVTIIGEDVQKGTSTDAQGNFRFKNIAYGDYNLKLSFVGYRLTNKQVTINNEQVDVSVEMNKKRYGMDEVVISATRELESREDIPASVTSISSEEMEQQSAITSD
ncbi:MAG: carboxypeptidase-like regulatory domain-containing protein, partial [Candidatus Halalkalibacterium sp. M3_1C_030]